MLDHLNLLCFHPLQMASAGSPALFARVLDAGMRTLLVDECDKNLRRDRPGVEDVLVINSGYRRGGTRPVLVPGPGGTWVASEMPTFSPLAMAGLSPDLPDDTLSRTIGIPMLPDLAGVTEESDWEVVEQPTMALGESVAKWAASIVDLPDVNLPSKCIGRMKEKWRPMMRVAVLAGGDAWRDRCWHLVEREIEQRDHDRREV